MGGHLASVGKGGGEGLEVGCSLIPLILSYASSFHLIH